MPKQVNLFKMKGTIGDATFYKTKNGHLVREKGGIPASRIKTDPSFERTRENMSDFAYSGQAMKLVREAFMGIIGKAGDKDFPSRLLKKIRAALKLDITHDRGQLTLNSDNLHTLEDFEFNTDAPLFTILGCRPEAEVVRSTGIVTINVPNIRRVNLQFPDNAVGFSLVATAAAIDFANGDLEIVEGESDLLTIGHEPIPVDSLILSLPPNVTHPIFVVLGVHFYMQQGPKLYQANNEGHSAFKILAIEI